jgi:hypothetical protein
MICHLCHDTQNILPERKSQLLEHLVVTLDEKNHFHVHGPVSNTELMKEFIKAIAKESKLDIEDTDQEVGDTD